MASHTPPLLGGPCRRLPGPGRAQRALGTGVSSNLTAASPGTCELLQGANAAQTPARPGSGREGGKSNGVRASRGADGGRGAALPRGGARRPHQHPRLLAAVLAVAAL